MTPWGGPSSRLCVCRYKGENMNSPLPNSCVIFIQMGRRKNHFSSSSSFHACCIKSLFLRSLCVLISDGFWNKYFPSHSFHLYWKKLWSLGSQNEDLPGGIRSLGNCWRGLWCTSVVRWSYYEPDQNSQGEKNKTGNGKVVSICRCLSNHLHKNHDSQISKSNLGLPGEGICWRWKNM